MEVYKNSHIKDKMQTNRVSKVLDYCPLHNKILVIRILLEICIVICENNIKIKNTHHTKSKLI